MLKRTITSDRAWIYDYDVETHVQSTQRIHFGERLKTRQSLTIREIEEKPLVKLMSLTQSAYHKCLTIGKNAVKRILPPTWIA